MLMLTDHFLKSPLIGTLRAGGGGTGIGIGRDFLTH
jgi:hypothetical protein